MTAFNPNDNEYKSKIQQNLNIYSKNNKYFNKIVDLNIELISDYVESNKNELEKHLRKKIVNDFAKYVFSDCNIKYEKTQRPTASDHIPINVYNCEFTSCHMRFFMNNGGESCNNDGHRLYSKLFRDFISITQLCEDKYKYKLLGLYHNSCINEILHKEIKKDLYDSIANLKIVIMIIIIFQSIFIIFHNW